MKVIKKSESVEFDGGKTLDAIEYHLDDEDVNGAIGIITGRYPEKGRVVNKVCKELVYVLSGSVKLVVEGEEVVLEEGDEVLILPGERYYWEGNCKIFMACTPAWYPEQHEEVE
jgi:molybdopterin converting factor small subunit